MGTESWANSRVAVAVLVFTFLAGAATGSGLFASFGRHHGGPPPHGFHPGPGPGPGPRPGPGRLPPPLEGLDLTREQRAKAEAVFESYRPKFEAVFDEARPRLEALRAQMEQELEPVLDASQLEKLKAFRAQRPRE